MNLYRLTFSKKGEICYVGHLDLMTALRRSVKRAGLPVKYSVGFNPHMEIGIAMPLPLGMEGLCEYAEITLTDRMDELEIMDRLNKAVPPGIFIKYVSEIRGKTKSAAAMICRAEYEAEIVSVSEKECYNDILSKIEELKDSEEIIVMKKTKSGEGMKDIKPDIFDINGRILDGRMYINMELSAGSDRNLKPELVIQYLLNGIGTETGIGIGIDGKFEKRYTRKKLIFTFTLAPELN